MGWSKQRVFNTVALKRKLNLHIQESTIMDVFAGLGYAAKLIVIKEDIYVC